MQGYTKMCRVFDLLKLTTGAAPGQEFPPPGSWEHSLSSCQPGDAMHEIILKGVKKYECSQECAHQMG